MNNSKRILIFSILVVTGLVAVMAIKHSRQPDADGTSSAPTASSPTSPGRPGLDATGGSAANAATTKPQVISGLESRAPAEPAAPSGEYFYDPSAPHAGQMVIATVQVGERSHKLSPNEVGDFDRVNVAPRQTIPVKLQYPEAQPGQTVVVQVMDGGAMVAPDRPPGIDNDLVRLLTLDESRSAEMAFRVTNNDGTHRLVLMRGADKKVLDFWVQN